jgi:hypothetical protein
MHILLGYPHLSTLTTSDFQSILMCLIEMEEWIYVQSLVDWMWQSEKM